MKISETKNQSYQPTSTQKTVGVVAGFGVATLPLWPSIPNIGKLVPDAKIEKQKKFLQKLDIEIAPFAEIKKYADKILEETKLKSRGLKIYIVNPQNVDKLRKLPKSPKTFIQKLNYIKKVNKNKILANGLNASFRPSCKAVYINDKHLYSAVFHEMGHALNYFSSNGRFLQKLGQKSRRAVPFVALGSLLVGLFSSKKSHKENETVSNGQKFVSFVRNNAGKLIFLTGLPLITEEALASYKGFNLAKKYLTAAQHKIHVRNQIVALSTYVLGSLVLAGSVSLGIKVKDKIVEQKK